MGEEDQTHSVTETPPAAQPGQPTTANEYIVELKKLKDNTVAKDDYEKMKAERDQLIRSIAETGVKPDDAEDKNAPEDVKARRERIKELRGELLRSDNNTTNLKFVSNAVELRELILKDTDGRDDIFVANNAAYTPTGESYEAAERVADVFKQCIEAANGDSGVFTAVLQSRVKDVVLPKVINKTNRR